MLSNHRPTSGSYFSTVPKTTLSTSPKAPPKTYSDPAHARAPKAKRGVHIGLSCCQPQIAGSKRSSDPKSSRLESYPPTTYTRPWTAAAARHARPMRNDGNECQTPRSWSKRSAAQRTLSSSSRPPMTYMCLPMDAAAAAHRGVCIDGIGCHTPASRSRRSADLCTTVSLLPPTAQSLPSTVATDKATRATFIEGICSQTSLPGM
mmetsp:Transcript_76434/g.212313  ORF Transcript_76434/g.212313 Transcript_76434/m.212313 type:complete len:205 (-) Transcript_76434:629-1243(-)